jgi:superfamily II DNA or RNA helicase
MLRPYQSKTLDAIRSNYQAGIRRQVVSAATGTGKSRIFAHIPKLQGMPEGQVLVHTEELIEQNAEANLVRLWQICPTHHATSHMGVGTEAIPQ